MKLFKLKLLFFLLIPSILVGQNNICSGNSISVSTTGYNNNPNFTQNYVLADNNGNILSSNSTGNFTIADYGYSYLGNLSIYAVNTNDPSLMSYTSSNTWSNFSSLVTSTCAEFIGPTNFTILSTDTTKTDTSACDTFTWSSNNQTYTSSGQYFENLTNTNGCDSILELNLTINNCQSTFLCLGSNLTQTSTGQNTNPGYQQNYVLVDTSNNNIIAYNSTGTFTPADYGPSNIGTHALYALNTNDPTLQAALNNQTWNNIQTIAIGLCSDIIGPKFFTIENCCDLVVTASTNSESCVGENDGSINILISGTNNYDINLNSIAQQSGVSQGSYNINNLNSGNYTLTISNNTVSNCDTTINLTVSAGNPTYSSLIDTIICNGSSVSINGFSYSAANPTGSQLFSSINGCDSTINIIVSELSAITGTFDTILCFGESLIINGTTYDGVNNNGTEILSAANGCDSTLNITIIENAEIAFNIDTTICKNDTFNLNNIVYDSNNTTGNQIFNAVNGCDSIVYINLTFLPIPNVGSNFSDSTVCIDDTILIYGTGANSYIWNNNVIDSEPVISPDEGTYFVVGTDSLNCTNSFQFDLSLEYCQEFELDTVNIFTPNNDGINDVFQMSGTSFETISMKIFNRWGQMIYENNEGIGWNGYLASGINAKPGTYFYIVEILPLTNIQSEILQIKGYLKLIRE